VTVLLDGQGADELLAGYPIYQAAWWATLARRGQWGFLGREIEGYSRRFGGARALRLREAARLALPEGLAARIGELSGSARPGWLGARLRERRFRRAPIDAPFADPLRRLMYGFLVAQNLPALLRYEDRNSMAFGIEARVPFLDEPLVEMAFALPATQLVRDGESKWLMRRALRGLLPEVVRVRQDKLGFATPGDTWLRDELAPLADELLASASLRGRGYVDPGAAGALWARHRAGTVDAHHTLWRCIHLELWARRFLDRRPVVGVVGAEGW
jgi:asparagine synthase (glutamine-hydrolysing)